MPWWDPEGTEDYGYKGVDKGKTAARSQNVPGSPGDPSV